MREPWQHLGFSLFDGEAVAGAEGVDLAVLDEAIGPADADNGDSAAELLQRLGDRRTEAAHLDVIFKGDEGRDTAGEELEHFHVERLDEARIDESGGVAGTLEARGKLGAERD